MGNYTSREAQLLSEIKSHFDKIRNKNTIFKNDIVLFKAKSAELKTRNPDSESFRKLANKASRMVENFKGQVRTTEYKDLEEFEKRLVNCEIN